MSLGSSADSIKRPSNQLASGNLADFQIAQDDIPVVRHGLEADIGQVFFGACEDGIRRRWKAPNAERAGIEPGDRIVRINGEEIERFEDILRVVNVNLVGVLNGIHLAAPLLKATPNSLCFSTSSSSATMGMPGIAVYSATKHAVKGLTESLSGEFARYGVRVADTLPGLIDTPLIPDALRHTAVSSGMFRLIQPVEVAKAVWASYHDEPDRLHWFVPAEIGDLDKASALDPEGTRAKLAVNAAFLDD